MHRPEYLDEVVRYHQFIKSNLTCTYVDPDDLRIEEEVKYSDVCGPFCDGNVVIEYFMVSPYSKIINF